jgi:hypothetical protein
MAHNFDDKQQIDSQGSLSCATGPVDPPAEKMFWIAAFVYQNQPAGHYAAAWGEKQFSAGGVKDRWTCPTKMAPGSEPFDTGTARAWALARVTDGGGKFFAWGDEVTLE